jgi:anti-sigma regulatory factor (Ser/Thr protein kinase)
MSFTPLPAHVRTARLVATAVARRSGVDEALLDEVRLAVGEACSRAVEAHQEFCPGEPVRVALTGADGRFEVVVTDAAAQGGGAVPAMAQAAARPAGGQVSGGEAQGKPPGGLPPVPAELGLAVIAGLADDVEIVRTEAGLSIRMSWPTSPPA